MSKLMEALKASAKEKPAVSAETGARPVNTDYEMTQEQLAEIYFSGGEKRPHEPRPPMIIKVVEKPGIASVIPWIITSIAFLITAFSLFSTKRVFVDIKIIDEKSGYFAPAAMVPHAPVSELAEEPGDRLSLRGAVFEGAGRLKSEASKDGLVLINASVAPFARASVRLSSPTNLTGCKIVFDVRGTRGGEKIGFSLKDKNNNAAFEKGKVFPFPDGLSTEWRRAEIPLDGTAKEFNARNVVSMRFEFGSNVGNKAGDTVYVKDLRIV